MLKKRSKSVSSKQGVMPHSISLTSFSGNLAHRPISSSSLFSSMNPLLCLYPRQFPDRDETAGKNPNTTLKINPFTSICNPFFSYRKPRPSDARDSIPVGLSIVDSLICEKPDDKQSIAENRIVWSGSQIKVQIPSPHCPIEYGVKNKDIQLALALLSPNKKSPPVSAIASMDNSPRALCLSASEMELSEDYTCVISHGPQKKKTHIFDNCIIGSYSNEFNSLGKIRASADQFGTFSSEYFSHLCHSCTSQISQGSDVFIYRERAFCCEDCRNRDIAQMERRDYLTS